MQQLKLIDVANYILNHYFIRQITMKKLIILFCYLITSVTLYAVPAKRVAESVRQKDGSILTVLLCGDESFHYFSSIDGTPLSQGADGNFYYGKIENNSIVSSGILAHDPSMRDFTESSYINFSSANIKSSIRSIWSLRSSIRNSNRHARSTKYRKQFISSRKRSQSISTTNTKKGLVILVNYKDREMKSPTAHTDFYNQFNQKGYNKNKHIGSVRDYFIDQSYGQLIIDFDVVGPYPLSKNLSYYGENDSQGDDKHPAEMVAEACTLADPDVNYSDYDWDGDGEVDQVYVIYAGYGEASRAPSNTIWPHEWSLSAGKEYGDGNGPLTLDGTTIDTYACSNELTGTSGSEIDGIGTACHEFSHCLGIPDFYDTAGDNFGMDSWSVMDYGCYNGPSGYEGNVPCGYTAYERWYSGWIDLIELNNGCEVSSMPSITDSPQGYIIYNDGNRNEYYVLTNIQKTSWNTYSGGHGLLIQHIDYDEDAWYDNVVNNTKDHERCTIFACDNKYSGSNISGDPYPSSTNNSLTDTSIPSASLFNKNTNGSNLMSKPITDIKEVNGLISFTFNGGEQLEIPIATSASDIHSTGFTANWEPVSSATSYILELQEEQVSKASLILDEDFEGLVQLPINQDLSETLGNYTKDPNWTGSQVVSRGNASVKLGKSNTIGSITTPLIKGIKSGKLTIYLKCSPYSSTCDFNVQCGNVVKNIQTDSNSTSVSFNVNSSEEYRITISTTASSTRAFIYEIAILDGSAQTSDIESILSSGLTSIEGSIINSTIYKGLTSTSYTFDGLSESKYWYRVKSADGTLVSDWSNKIEVNLPISTYINELESTPNSDVIKVYSLNGIFIGSFDSLNQLKSISSGIYILKQGNRTIKYIQH